MGKSAKTGSVTWLVNPESSWTPEPTHTFNHYLGLGEGQCLLTSQKQICSWGKRFLGARDDQVEADNCSYSWEESGGRLQQLPVAADPNGWSGSRPSTEGSGRLPQGARAGKDL